MSPLPSRIPLILVLILPLSCSDMGDINIDQSAGLIPLKIGNHWEYADSIFYGSGSVGVYHYTWSIVGRQRIFWPGESKAGDSIEVYVFRWSDSTHSADSFYRNSLEGLIRYLGKYDPTGQEGLRTLLLKYPLHPGDTWQENQGDYYNLLTCISTDTTILTQWRGFHCYQVRYSSEPGSKYQDRFYSYNFGLVAGFTKSDGYVTRVKTTLLSFLVQ